MPELLAGCAHGWLAAIRRLAELSELYFEDGAWAENREADYEAVFGEAPGATDFQPRTCCSFYQEYPICP